MSKRIAFISVDNTADSICTSAVSIVYAEFDERDRGPLKVLAEHLFPQLTITQILEGLRKVDIIVSHSARAEAVYLSRVDKHLLQIDWYCSSTQWLGKIVPSSILNLASSFRLELNSSRGSRKSNAMLLCEALSLHIGKTKRSKRYLDVIIDKGAWPVFSTLNPTPNLFCEGVSFSRIFSDTLTKCSLKTQFQLWSSPDSDSIIGYPRCGFMVGGKLPSAFHIDKCVNSNLAERVDAGESLCLVSQRVINDCFHLSLQQSDYTRYTQPCDT